ncbi:hypothetical protein Celaphus_00010757 [Cervus elaphus hippelaphus]|uniref:Uncharacterized protein n=1 Tax=Cervus elaphus hippelaphus TaxID=46360 RepID=A0A212CRR3_CEREH|nr:hypothetical protein Celaphus_00010757 [Cervus elaphus hippelaphus]
MRPGTTCVCWAAPWPPVTRKPREPRRASARSLTDCLTSSCRTEHRGLRPPHPRQLLIPALR